MKISRGYEFEKEHGGVYGRAWKEKKEGRNVIILLSQFFLKKEQNKSSSVANR